MQLGWTAMLTHPQQIAGSMFLATVLQHVASNRIIFDSHRNIVCFFGALFTTRYLKQAASDIYDLKFRLYSVVAQTHQLCDVLCVFETSGG